MSCLRREAAASCVLTVCLLLTAPALAQDASRERAAEHFDRGISYVDEREFALAAQEFERAYQLGRHVAVLYNLGLAYAAVGRYRDARRTLDTYLNEGGSKLTEGRRNRVRSLVQEYEKKLARLRVTTHPIDAEVFVDGEHQADPSAIDLDPGRHVVTVRAAGHSDSTATVELAMADDEALTIELDSVAGPPERGETLPSDAALPEPAAATLAESKVPDRSVAYIVGGGAVLLGGAALAIYLSNDARFEDWKETEATLPPSGTPLNSEQRVLRQEQNELRSSIETWDWVARGTGIAAGLALGVAGVAWITADGGTSPEVGFLAGPSAIGLRGTF